MKETLTSLEKQNRDQEQEINLLKVEVASLKAEVAKLSQKPTVQPKPKRNLLANIREAVTSPRRGPSTRTLRKTSRPGHS